MPSWEVCREPHPTVAGIDCHFGKGHERVFDPDDNDDGGRWWDHGDPAQDYWWNEVSDEGVA